MENISSFGGEISIEGYRLKKELLGQKFFFGDKLKEHSKYFNILIV